MPPKLRFWHPAVLFLKRFILAFNSIHRRHLIQMCRITQLVSRSETLVSNIMCPRRSVCMWAPGLIWYISAHIYFVIYASLWDNQRLLATLWIKFAIYRWKFYVQLTVPIATLAHTTYVKTHWNKSRLFKQKTGLSWWHWDMGEGYRVWRLSGDW